MDHRYGRHGPRAWLRWHKRHYTRPSTLPVPVTRVAVIRVQLPIYAERVIIIMEMPEEFEENKEEKTPPLPFPDSRLIGPSQDAGAEFFKSLKKRAEYEGDAKCAEEIQNVLDKGAEWTTEKAIEREAYKQAIATLRPHIEANIDIEAAKLFFVRHYMTAYRAHYERETGNGTLPNDETKRIQNVARNDFVSDKQDGVDLSEVEMTYQAVIRIQELLAYRTRASSGYLTHIMGHISRYKSAYREEKDRPVRSGPFPGGQGKGGSIT